MLSQNKSDTSNSSHLLTDTSRKILAAVIDDQNLDSIFNALRILANTVSRTQVDASINALGADLNAAYKLLDALEKTTNKLQSKEINDVDYAKTLLNEIDSMIKHQKDKQKKIDLSMEKENEKRKKK